MPLKSEGYGITSLVPEEPEEGYITESTTSYNNRVEGAAKAGVSLNEYFEPTPEERREYMENAPVEDWEMNSLLYSNALKHQEEKDQITRRKTWEGQEHGGRHNTGRSIGDSSKGRGRLSKRYYDDKGTTKDLSDEQRRIQDKEAEVQGLEDYKDELELIDTLLPELPYQATSKRKNFVSEDYVTRDDTQPERRPQNNDAIPSWMLNKDPDGRMHPRKPR